VSDPHPSHCALIHGSTGLVVKGAPDSIELVLADAKRQNEQTVHLLTDAGVVEVDATGTSSGRRRWMPWRRPTSTTTCR
jgi:hypothetical protein